MAEKRMFAMQIVDSDAFLTMPLSSQALYFHLSMRADDDGFLNNAQRIMKMINANQNDYDVLVAKSFIIEFEDGVCVVKHWRINNYIRKDRYRETVYTDEKDMLLVKKNGSYSLKGDGYQELQKDFTRIDTINIEETHSVRPQIIEMRNPAADTSSINFNMEKAWDDTFALYPKKKNAFSSRTAWLDIISSVIDENKKDVAKSIAFGLQMYLNDYKKKNPDDELFVYIPSFDNWLREESLYWSREYEKTIKGRD